MTEHYYQNKTALITGGSSGIGLAFAKGLLEYGASVTLLARDQQKLEDAKASSCQSMTITWSTQFHAT